MVVSFFHSFFVAAGEDALAYMFMPNVGSLVLPVHDGIASLENTLFDGLSWLDEVPDVVLKVVYFRYGVDHFPFILIEFVRKHG